MSKQKKFKKYPIFGVEIDSPTVEQAIDYIISHAAKPASPAVYVTKPYVEFLDRAYEDPQIVELLNDSELCLPDGVALNWAASYLFGGPHTLSRVFATLAKIMFAPKEIMHILPARFAGTNSTWPLLEAAAARGLKVMLVGSPSKQTITQTATIITKRLPDISIVATHHGKVTNTYVKELVEKIRKAKPDIILVGLGFPLQEKIMSASCKYLQHGVFVGEGGTFDYKSFGGKYSKAPAFLQYLGLEWLWRLILQPSRIKRQLAIPRFIWRVYYWSQ